MTLKDKVTQGYTVKGHVVLSTDVEFVYRKLQQRLLFTMLWVEKYLLQRKVPWGQHNRAADRLLQRWRILGLIEFDKGYWNWTLEGKKCVV